MPPIIALTGCIISILYLLYKEAKLNEKIPFSIYVPVIWFALAFSKPLSLWLNLGSSGSYSSVSQVAEGSATDRYFLIVMILIGLYMLSKRELSLGDIIRQNKSLAIFFFFCAISALWSDFPFVSIKRYIKSCGSLIMVLCILATPNALAHFRTAVKRVAYILIPLSVLFIKYYPVIGRYYDPFMGYAFSRGVTWSKNSLGNLCFIFGLFFIWNFFHVLKIEDEKERKHEIFVHGVFMVAIMWLLLSANSATSLGCLIIGGGILFMLRSDAIRNNISFIVVCLLILGGVAISTNLLSDILGFFTGTLGRDTSLTGRTDLWVYLLKYNFNSLIGVGYESFWLGERLKGMWELYWWKPNQAHNGYLEIYINLGIIGLVLLGGILITAYRRTTKGLRENHPFSEFCLAFLSTLILYNITEASFGGLHPMWMILMFCVIGTDLNDDSEQAALEER